MSDPSFFSSSYAEARARFLDAVGPHSATVETIPLPGHVGPDGGQLGVDVAVLGDPDSPAALLMVCGTHGAEGYAGSACQLDYLCSGPDPGIAVVAVHGLNPFGFAHGRRVNEDNVDINRNFVDHRHPPVNEAYGAIHPYLVPADWDGEGHRTATRGLAEAAGRLGTRGVQAAVTLGQYGHPDGLFFGGTSPCWSNTTFRQILQTRMADFERVAYVDLHTGLGDRGNGEPIFRGGDDPSALERARVWYGDRLTRSEAGTSSSTPIGGNTARAVAQELPPGTVLTAITLEFGTQDGLTVLQALQADNWLWQQRGPEAVQAAERHRASIRDRMTEAFNPQEGLWRRSVLAHGADILRTAAARVRH